MVPSGHILCNSLGKQEIYLFSYVLYVFPLTKKIGLCDGHLIQTKMHFKLQTGNLRNLDNNSCWLHCQSEEKVQFMSVTYDWQSLWGLKISLLNYVTEPCKERSRAAFSFSLKNYYSSYSSPFWKIGRHWKNILNWTAKVQYTLLLFEGIEGIPMCALFFP